MANETNPNEGQENVSAASAGSAVVYIVEWTDGIPHVVGGTVERMGRSTRRRIRFVGGGTDNRVGLYAPTIDEAISREMLHIAGLCVRQRHALALEDCMSRLTRLRRQFAKRRG